MTLDDYPLFKAALDKVEEASVKSHAAFQLKNPNRPVRPYNANYQIGRVKTALEIATAALEDGTILNPSYLQVKDTLNRAIEEAYTQVFTNPYLSIDHADERRDGVLRDLYYASKPSLHSAAGLAKKVAKALKAAPTDELVRDAAKFMMEIVPFAEQINSLKDKIVKRKVLSPEEREAEVRKVKYTPPPSNSNAVAKVRAILEEFVEESYQRLFDAIYNGNKNLVALYFAACNDVVAGKYEGAKKRSFRGEEIPHRIGSFTPYEYCRLPDGKIDSRSAQTIDKVVELGVRPDGEKGYVEIANADSALKAMAEADAKDIRESYVVKTLKKLTSILEAKGDDNFLSVTKHPYKHTSLSYLEGAMIIAFKDGSRFTASNSVVLARSVLGNLFARYPLTFHDVALPGGVKMSAPSEKRMNTVFLGKDG